MISCLLCSKTNTSLCYSCEDNHTICKMCGIKYYVQISTMVGTNTIKKSGGYSFLCPMKDCKKKLLVDNILTNKEYDLEIKLFREKKINELFSKDYYEQDKIFTEKEKEFKRKEQEYKKKIEEYEEKLKKQEEETKNIIKIKKENREEMESKKDNEIKNITKERNNIKRKFDELEEILECNICMDKKVDTTLLPCMHCYCEECSNKMNSCPFCKKKITQRRKIFI